MTSPVVGSSRIGSVAIEWCRVDYGCRAMAFEQDEARAARIEQNAAALGAAQLTVLGAAPTAFADTEDPDAVFIGGGLTTPGVFEGCWSRLRPGGRLVANAVTLESEAVLLRLADEYGGTLRRLEFQHRGPLGGFTVWRPQLPVVQWAVTRDPQRTG